MSEDLIRRSDAVNELAKFLGVPARAFIHEAENLLKVVPSAQRNGKWITMMVDCSNILLPFCSVCNKPLMFHDHNLRPNFCPNCGAEMRQDDPSHPFADDVMMKGEEDE